MTLTHYLLSAKKENLKLLFWLLVNTGCLLFHGFLSARAITALVALDANNFLLYCLFILGNSCLWMVQIRQVSIAREIAIQTMNTAIRKDISQELVKAHYQDFHKKEIATYTSWMTNDIQTIQDLGFETLELMITQILNVIGAATTLAIYHPSFLISLFLLTILMTIVPRLFSEKMAKQTKNFSIKNEELIHTITDLLKGYDILKNAGKQKLLITGIERSSLSLKNAKISYSSVFGTMMATQNGTSFISQITILTQAGILFYWKLIPIGLVAQAQYFASITFAGLTGFLANYTELKTTREIFQKFNQLNSNALISQELNFTSQITLDKVSFNYDQHKIFKDLSLSLQKGDKVALMSPSGKGKSTLLKLLAGQISPQEGKFSIDKEVINQLSIDYLVSLLPQEAHIFKGSLRFNLTLDEPIPDHVLYQTMRLFQLDEFLNHDLDQKIMTEENRLSGGQKQRLALARAFLQDKPILLLDEATSAIDETRSNLIMEFLLDQTDKTIIFATHHLSDHLANKCDQIIHL